MGGGGGVGVLAESRGQGVEVCSSQTVAQLLWRQVHSATTSEHPALPEDRVLLCDQYEQVDLLTHFEGQSEETEQSEGEENKMEILAGKKKN